MTTTAIPVAHHAPVTPPPENMAFPKGPRLSAEHEEPFSMKAFQNPAFQSAQLKFQQANAAAFPQTQQPPRSPTASSTTTPSQPATAVPPPPPPHQQQAPQQQSHIPQVPFMPSADGQLPTSPSVSAAAASSLDPKYLAMVSRIASYYQQRCQAVANYQQQRCQAWATMHRQKCQEMVQAAMLVVAWYIRDRIQRRRRRQKRQFRKGLADRMSRSKVTKGEVVRRWVLQVPEAAPSPNEAHRQRLVDREEADFNMDSEVPLDKDTKLFSVADNLIKSQLSKIEVPLMGALSFDESESEEEEEEEEEPENEDEYGQVAQDDLEDCEDELYDDDDDDEMSLDDYDEDDLGSDLVQNGTGDSSRLKERDSSVS